ncbi:hypothetical protein KAW65_08105 [candidate division WOR-3 bacterium]|nr:hypothetical protein [candidate division WOR-3 bacterium]
MHKVIIILGLLIAFNVARAQKEKPTSLGKIKLEIEAFEDRTIYAKTRIIPLKTVRASEIEPFIRTRLSMYGAVQINDALNTMIITDMEPKLSDLVKLVKELDAKGIKGFVRLETEIISPKYVLPSKLWLILKENLSPDGSIQIDNDLNAIMITDVRSRIERIKEIVDELDIPPRQVLIEGKLVAIDSDYLREFGMHLPSILEGTMRGSIEADFHHTKPSEYRAHISLNLPTLISFIDQAVAEGKATISSIPNIVVQNNREGEIYLSGNTELYLIPHIGAKDFINLEVQFLTGGEPEYNSEVAELRKQAALKIKVTPEYRRDYYRYYSRSGDKYRSYYDGEYRGSDRDYYSYSYRGNRGITTTIMVKDGNTFTLGGIEYEQTSVVEKGVPILKSIPILGYFFKHEVKITSKKELMILITPHILEFGELPEKEEK